MKNSLFKRAIAAAAAVPLALTQCLTVANAASVTDAAPSLAKDTAITASESKTITLKGSENSLLYIEPKEVGNEKEDKYQQIAADTFIKDSLWNQTAYGYLKAAKQSGKIDPTEIVNFVLKKARGYKAAAEKASEKLEDCTYEIVDDTIIVKGKISNANFNGDVKKTLGAKMWEIARRSGDMSLVSGSYADKVDGSGDFTITIHTEYLETSTEIPVEFKYVPTNKKLGNELDLGQLPEFTVDLLETLTAEAVARINASTVLTAAEKEADIKDLTDWMNKNYINRAKKAQNYVDRSLKFKERTKEADNISELIAAVNKQITKRGYKRQIPATGSAIAANSQVAKAYNKAVERFNNATSYTLNIAASELGAEADTIYDIKADAKGGYAHGTAKYRDDEQEAVKAYFAATPALQQYKVVDTWKEIEITAKFDGIKDTSTRESVDVKFQRVVKVEPIVTTTSSTTPSTTSSTTVVTSDTDTTPSGPVDTTPTDTTPVTPGTDTTPVDTNTTPVDTNTTPVDTDTTPVDTNTTPTDTGTTPIDTDTTPTAPVNPTVSTTRTVDVVAPVIKADTTVGFYLDIDEKFNDEQINSLKYSVDLVRQYIDEDDVVVGYESLTKGEQVDILDKVSFGTATPVNTYVEGSSEFAHQVALIATEDITAADGTVIATAGSTLKNPDGSDVSVTVYIGVKGDANLDHKVDAGDATTTLIYYSALSTGQKAAETQFSNSALVANADDVLDHFAAFLCDTTNEPMKDENNWKLMKPERKIMADDATFILSYYSELSIKAEKGRPTWNLVMGIQ
ncbi:MAG: cellulose-binding protein CttA-related protein [Ruminococcus sp.]|nr:cellulose-binding protein CttA-related protein [Ruminococcus sp.]